MGRGDIVPIKYKIISYGCKFKCGFKRKHSYTAMLDHEKYCWYNPEKQTCKTCKYENYYQDWDGNGNDKWWVRECKHTEGKKKIDKLYEQHNDFRDIGNEQIPPSQECEFWAEK